MRRSAVIGLLSFAALLGEASSQAAMLVPGPDKQEMILVLEPGESASHFLLNDPDRLVVDIKGATIPLQLHSDVSARLAGRGVRQSFEGPTQRVVLDLFPGESKQLVVQPETRRINLRFPKSSNPDVANKSKGGLRFSSTGFGWELTLKGAGQISPRFETRFDPPQLLVRLPQLQMKAQEMKIPSGPVRSIAVSPKSDGTLLTLQMDSFLPYNWVPGQDGRLVLQRPALAGKTIVVDPGHGGHDPGALSLNGGHQEKKLVLDISLRVRDLLQKSGANVIMSRVDDTFLSLQERAQLANQNKASIFVSIHANSLPWNPGANGTETYYFNDPGKKLAQAIQPQLIQSTQQTDRGVRNARFYVIRFAQMPSVLIETGFVTNEGDLGRLKNPNHQYNFAAAVVNGIEVFYGGKPFQALRGRGNAPPPAPAIVQTPRPIPVTKEEARVALKFTKEELAQGNVNWEAF